MQEAANYASRIADCKVEGLCGRCTDIVQSKKSGGKYRPMKQPAKCAACGQKTVFQAYCTYCQACANCKRVCMRCGDKRAVPKARAEQDNMVAMLQAQLEAGGHSERERRTLLRKIEKAKEVRREVAKQVREAIAAGLTAADFPSDEEGGGEEEGADEKDDELAEAAPAAASQLTAKPQFRFDPKATLEFDFASPTHTCITPADTNKMSTN